MLVDPVIITAAGSLNGRYSFIVRKNTRHPSGQAAAISSMS